MASFGLQDLLDYQETVRQSAIKEATRARKKGIKNIEDYLASRGLYFSGETPERLTALEEILLEPTERMETEFARQKLTLKEQLEGEKKSRLANILKLGGTIAGGLAGQFLIPIPGAGAKIGAMAGAGLGAGLGSGLGALFGLSTGAGAGEELIAGLSAMSTEDLLRKQKELYDEWIKAIREKRSLADVMAGADWQGYGGMGYGAFKPFPSLE